MKFLKGLGGFLLRNKVMSAVFALFIVLFVVYGFVDHNNWYFCFAGCTFIFWLMIAAIDGLVNPRQ